MALIVSQTLPRGMRTFDRISGVWVTAPRCAVAVAVALRETLIAVSAARLASEGQQTKMELVYRYLTGPRFRHRIEAVVERVADMQGDLDRERKTMMRLWSKREEQIRGVVEFDGKALRRPARDCRPNASGNRRAGTPVARGARHHR